MNVGGDLRAHTDGHQPESADATVPDPAADRVGWFRHYADADRWEWSPQVQAMFGYEPGTVTPNTELVLSHEHPDDYGQVTATLEDVRQHRRASSTNHRIVDTGGAIHQVMIVADTLVDDSGQVVGTHGFYVDLTQLRQGQEDKITAAVADISENRAVIEQAKGMVMFVYGIDANAAFHLLRWQSQQHNVKLRVVAEQIAEDFTRAAQQHPVDRATYDNLLLTAHTRAASRR